MGTLSRSLFTHLITHYSFVINYQIKQHTIQDYVNINANDNRFYLTAGQREDFRFLGKEVDL